MRTEEFKVLLGKESRAGGTDTREEQIKTMNMFLLSRAGKVVCIWGKEPGFTAMETVGS